MGKKLQWPISENDIGKQVKFILYTNPAHHHWGFKENRVYTIGRDKDGDVGPMNDRNEAAYKNWGFEFEYVNELPPVGYNGFDCDGDPVEVVAHHNGMAICHLMEYSNMQYVALNADDFYRPEDLAIGDMVNVLETCGSNDDYEIARALHRAFKAGEVRGVVIKEGE